MKNAARDLGKLGEWERSERTLRTPDVTLAGGRLWYLVKGAGRAYAAVNSHTLIRGPLQTGVETSARYLRGDQVRTGTGVV